MDPDKERFLATIRRFLGRSSTGMSPSRLPPIPAPRLPGDLETETDLLIQEINALSGQARALEANLLPEALKELVQMERIRKATLWSTPYIHELKLSEHLRELDVEIVPAIAGKYALAQCDLGVTEADFALPATGTLGLLSSQDRPRLVSLIPRVHLAVLRPAALRADLLQVFSEARNFPYLVLITGPSRTADIELTVTLGVHGPQGLYAWLIR